MNGNWETKMFKMRHSFTIYILILFAFAPTPVLGQTVAARNDARYLDQIGGVTADEAVRIALEKNDELAAVRKEIDAARGLLRQAKLRPNPSVEFNRREQIGGPDNNTIIGGSLPLELGGRRNARVKVAEAELQMRENQVANSERLLAAEVRMKFGDALAQTLKLNVIDRLLESALEGFRLIQARVTEGKIAPLDEGMASVEVNRLRSLRETESGKTEIAFLELKNMMGMRPEEPLRLKGNFDNLVDKPLPITESIQRALQTRPDLLAFRAAETVAEAQIEKAKAGGRLDAKISADYQRNDFGFPVQGIDQAGALRPVQDVFHSARIGVTFEIPVRNANQGLIEAAVADSEAAEKRREFAEIVVRREVAAAYARYESSARAMEIFRVGAQSQANANLEVVRQTYEFGARNLIEFLVEQRRYLDIENEFIVAQLAVYQANVEIMRATNAPELK
ncbi:MAG: TolC family protein [Pyrinomonadaceae bacterium]